jgi:Ca2+-binding RTX toxin-like protein
VNTTNLGETFSLAGVDGHAILNYDAAPNTSDLDNVERVAFSGLAGGGGLDRFIIGDLTGTEVKQVDIDLSVFPGGADGLMQTVQVGGLAGPELISASAVTGGVNVTAGGVAVAIRTIDGADRLAVNGGGGADTFDATALAGAITANFDGGDGADALAIRGDDRTNDSIALFGGSPTPDGDSVDFEANGVLSHVNLSNVETIAVTTAGGDDLVNGTNLHATATLNVDAGKGADTVFGGLGADRLDGNAGNDVIDGRGGNDLMLGGAGDDTLVWNPGGASDTVDGGAGFDTQVFNTANIGELISMIETGGRVSLTRDIAGITMDIDNVEKIAFGGAGGGQDVFFIGELSATEVVAVDVDLNPTGAPADGLVDSVSMVADASANRIAIAGSGGDTTVTGMHQTVHVANAEAIDRVVVNGVDGADTLDVTGFTGGVNLVLWGGNGSDAFVFGASSGASVEILDFQAHSLGGDGDVIVLSDFPDPTFGLAVANHHIVQSGLDVLISDVTGNVVTLRNTLITDLTSSDFVFG